MVVMFMVRLTEVKSRELGLPALKTEAEPAKDSRTPNFTKYKSIIPPWGHRLAYYRLKRLLLSVQITSNMRSPTPYFNQNYARHLSARGHGARGFGRFAKVAIVGTGVYFFSKKLFWYVPSCTLLNGRAK